MFISTRSETVIRQLTHAGLIQYFDVIMAVRWQKNQVGQVIFI